MHFHAAGKHAADILAMSLDGFMESRRILTSLAYAAGERASKIGAGGMGMQTEEYQALERLAAQNAIGIKVWHSPAGNDMPSKWTTPLQERRI